MFSPAVSQSRQTGTPAGSLRSSRRRQRSHEGSIPKAKRQRSALSSETFLPPDDGVLEMQDANQKIAILPTRLPSRELLPTPRRDIVVRSKKSRAGDRVEKGDGSSVLTKNDTYTVSKLLALPDRLRANAIAHQHGEIYPDSGFALTLTHTHAIIWPYMQNKSSPDTYTFSLPYPTKHVTDPLPLGALVSASTSSEEPGLVVVMPASGKITFWESITSADTLDLIKQQRNGVEMSIPYMHKGELVTEILNAESAGYVLAFSSGRTAYMSVRDSQGRPAISVQFGRSMSSNGGIFGSIRNYVKVQSSDGIAAVRAGPQDSVGERNVVVAMKTGKILFWRIFRGGHIEHRFEGEGRESIVMAMKEKQPSLSNLLLESFETYDILCAPKMPLDLRKQEGEHLILLVSLSSRESSHYAIVDVVLGEEFLVTNIRPIRSYTTLINKSATKKPRLYLPNPRLVAYIVFDRAVVVFSMAQLPDSPEAQLRTESHILPEVFEDVVDFHGDMDVEIVGSGMEGPHGQYGSEDSRSRRPKVKHPATILLVRDGGVVRIAATDMTKLSSSVTQRVTARSKLEQAVLFGNLDNNPLNFAVRPELQFPPDEVAAAALDLSLDILKSNITPHTSNTPAAIATNLQKRADALQHLAEYLKASGVTLDRVTRWKLLWNAEKMEAVSLIWKTHNASLALKPVGQKHGLLMEVVDSIHEDYRSEPVAEEGQIDRVRHWFIHDVWNLEIAIPWAFQTIKYSYQDGKVDRDEVINILSEANDLVIGAVDGAFNFRSKNLDLYGLAAEPLQHGILTKNYEGLPEFWTSTIFVVMNIRKQATLAGALLVQYWSKYAQENHNLEGTTIDKVRRENIKLVDLSIRTTNERTRWDMAQNTPEAQLEANSIQEEVVKAQHKETCSLAINLDLGNEALELAEKHEIMPTLAEVLKYETRECLQRLQEARLGSSSMTDTEKRFWQNRMNNLDEYVNRYFDMFGERWASALYENFIDDGSMYDLLSRYQEEKFLPYLTRFLRSKPEYAKIAWIHEINREHNFDEAANILLSLAESRERHLWNKKVELSLSKLARLASFHHEEKTPRDDNKPNTATIDHQLTLIKVQEEIYAYILPSISTAIDESAELQLAIEAYGNKRSKKQKALATLLSQALAELVNQNSMGALTLVDLLTLMESNQDHPEEGDFVFRQFYLALKALELGNYHKDEMNLVLRVIWRRCMLKDKWDFINNTESKDDGHVQEQLRQTALYMTLKTGLKNRMFDNNSTVKYVSPKDILAVSSEDLDHRFKNADHAGRESLVKDMEAETALLLHYVEHSQLDHWYQATLDLAKQDFTEDVNIETNGGQNMREIALRLEDIEKTFRDQATKAAEVALSQRPKKANGFSNTRRTNNLTDNIFVGNMSGAHNTSRPFR